MQTLMGAARVNLLTSLAARAVTVFATSLDTCAGQHADPASARSPRLAATSGGPSVALSTARELERLEVLEVCIRNSAANQLTAIGAALAPFAVRSRLLRSAANGGDEA
jgi:hypothetical protein